MSRISRVGLITEDGTELLFPTITSINLPSSSRFATSSVRLISISSHLIKISCLQGFPVLCAFTASISDTITILAYRLTSPIGYTFNQHQHLPSSLCHHVNPRRYPFGNQPLHSQLLGASVHLGPSCPTLGRGWSPARPQLAHPPHRLSAGVLDTG